MSEGHSRPSLEAVDAPPRKLQRTSSSPTVSQARASSPNSTTTTAITPSESPPPADLDDTTPEKRVSYYVQALDELVSAVLKHEAFLFSEAEQHALRRLQVLDYQARYLFVRLFLRKDTWIRLRSIGYENDITDLEAACAALWEVIMFTPPAPSPSSVKSEPKPAPPPVPREIDVIDLTGDDDDEEISTRRDLPKKELETTPEEDVRRQLSHLANGGDDLKEEEATTILSLLSLEELSTLGKQMKVNPGRGTRKEWTDALLRTSKQSTLSFLPARPISKGDGQRTSANTAAFGVSFDARGNKLNAASVVSKKALEIIGPVIRLSPAYRTLFNRLSLVFHRTAYTASSNNTSAFTASLLARFGKRHYPQYNVSRTFAIFPSRAALKQYERGLEVERRIEEILGETGWEKLPTGAPRRIKSAEEKKAEKDAMCRDGVALFLSVEGEWRDLCRTAEKEMKREDDDEERRLLYYRRRFHPGWPLTRVVYKAASIFAKLGDHEREVELLRALLAQTSFRRGKRGEWIDRLALVVMRYPLGEEAKPDCKPKKKERLRKARLNEALSLCLDGLASPYTHLIYKSSLQRRVSRIESSLDVPKDERRVFPELLAKSADRIMQGERLDDSTIGRKSIWQAGDGSEVSVEELALEQYQREGWKGFHSENGILTTIFTLVFWDVIFAPVDGVFETAYQSAPLDLATDAFAIVRRPLVDARLKAIRDGEAGKILAEHDDRERPLGTWAVGVNWRKFDKEDLLEIVECIGGEALATILIMFCEEYGHRTGGVPDLCLWNPERKRCLFSEVKGPGDTLSETQKVWIDVLLGAGVGVEVCRVMTHEDKDDFDAKLATGGRKKRGKTGSGSGDED